MRMLLLEEAIGYTFKDRSLLQTALTHPSYAQEHHAEHYQRLEFLGDAILQFVMSRILFDMLRDKAEGQLTLIRSKLVREDTLAQVAREIGIGEAMRISHGTEGQGGRENASILADMMEAVIAAVYLDGGMREAFRLIRDRLGPRIDEMVRDGGVDAKSKLQMLLEKIKPGLRPTYVLLSKIGPDHASVFTSSVTVNGQDLGEGTGHSKKESEQNAASAALKNLAENGNQYSID